MLKPERIACADCMHKGVCKYENDLHDAQTAVNNVKIDSGRGNANVAVSEMSWIAPVVLSCMYKRVENTGGIRARSSEL